MNGSAVRTGGGAARPWRMRQWPGDAGVAHLIFLDHLSVPTPEQVTAAVEHARRRGARSVRTSALFPAAADVVLDAGFHQIDRLALLRLDLADETLVDASPPARSRVRPMRTWHLARAAACDRAAFGSMWGNDDASLRDIRRATPRHRARMIRDGRDVAGFAISGSAGELGYLQRLAVAPTHRRRGLATDLVADGVAWMRDLRLTSCLVNTGIDNEVALALYRGLGFERLGEELVIAERAVVG